MSHTNDWSFEDADQDDPLAKLRIPVDDIARMLGEIRALAVH